jgi:hypothetical protein
MIIPNSDISETKSQRKILQNKLKNELEVLGDKEVSDSEAWEACDNLTGFFRVLQQMKKEALRS